MWSMGIDVHQRSFAVCILDDHGKMVKQMKLRGTLAKLLDTLRSIKEPFAVCYEACRLVNPAFEGQGEIGAQEIAGGEYAIARHTRPYEKLGDTYAGLCGQ